MEASQFVRSARARLRISQEEFAKLLGVERKTIGRYESGNNVPKRAVMAIRHLLRQQGKRK